MRPTLLALALLLATPACAQTPKPTASDRGPAVMQPAETAAGALSAAQLAAALDTLFDNHDTAKHTVVTLVVRDLTNGQTLYDRGGDKLLTPASNLKIYTAAAALDLLGPEYTWETSLTLTGRPSGTALTDAAVHLHGQGDPMLDTAQLAALIDRAVQQLQQGPLAGIRKIEGDLHVSTQPWADLPLKGPGWMWDDEPDYYNMSIQPVMLDFNTLEVTVTPADQPGKPAAVAVQPPTHWPPLRADVTTTDEPAAAVRIDRIPFTETLIVEGAITPHAQPVRGRVTMHDPARWIASVATHMFQERGVLFDVDPLPADPNVRPGAALPATVIAQQGKPLADAIQHFLRVSENAVGEMLLLHLAEKFPPEGFDAKVSWPAGAKVITDWLVREAGLDEGSFRLVDGSGLSRYNLISANSSIQLLDFIDDHQHFDVFFAGLPAYEVKLPDAGSWNDIPLAEFDPQRVHAKPGGMGGVSTISGYLDTLDGRRLAFSILANGYLGSNAPVRDLRDQVWATLVRYRADAP